MDADSVCPAWPEACRFPADYITWKHAVPQSLGSDQEHLLRAVRGQWAIFVGFLGDRLLFRFAYCAAAGSKRRDGPVLQYRPKRSEVVAADWADLHCYDCRVGTDADRTQPIRAVCFFVGSKEGRFRYIQLASRLQYLLIPALSTARAWVWLGRWLWQGAGPTR